MEFTSLYEWNNILNKIFEGTEYRAMPNGGKGSHAGIAIVPRAAEKPQLICVHPKERNDAAIVLKPYVYEKISKRIFLKPQSNTSQKVAFRDVPDNEIIRICKLLIS